MNTSRKVLGVFFVSLFVLVTIACSCNSITSQISGMVVTATPAATPTPALSLKGEHIRIVYIQQREADALLAADRLRAQGASVEIFLTSNDGNEKFINHVYYSPGYEQSAALIASLVSDIESVVPSAYPPDTTLDPNIDLALWIAEPK
jgi:hypothetical protein